MDNGFGIGIEQASSEGGGEVDTSGFGSGDTWLRSGR